MKYEVGYRKPPKHTQFKKGVSGNPRGRRRRQPLTGDDLLIKCFSGSGRILKNGKWHKSNLLELIIMQVIKNAIEGNTRGLRDIVAFVKQMPQRPLDEAPDTSLEQELAHLEAVFGHAARVAKAVEEKVEREAATDKPAPPSIERETPRGEGGSGQAPGQPAPDAPQDAGAVPATAAAPPAAAASPAATPAREYARPGPVNGGQPDAPRKSRPRRRRPISFMGA